MFYLKCFKLQSIIKYCNSKLCHTALKLVISVKREIVSIKIMGPNKGKGYNL